MKKLTTWFTLSFLIVMLFMCGSVSAQVKYSKGYVLMQNNDTLRGEIKTNAKREFDSFIKVFYRKSEGNEVKTFLPQKIKGYAVDSSFFVTRKIDGDMMFAKLLSSGTMTENVYEVQTQYDAMNTTKTASDYYIDKDNKDFTKIKSKKANKLIDDAKAKGKKVEVAELGLKD